METLAILKHHEVESIGYGNFAFRKTVTRLFVGLQDYGQQLNALAMNLKAGFSSNDSISQKIHYLSQLKKCGQLQAIQEDLSTRLLACKKAYPSGEESLSKFCDLLREVDLFHEMIFQLKRQQLLQISTISTPARMLKATSRCNAA